jgi:hypothetical protein
MESRFSIFFILTRALQLLIAITFTTLPCVIFFGNFQGFENSSRVAPTLMASVIALPLVYLMLNGFRFEKIKMTEYNMEILNLLNREKKLYPYDQIKQVTLSAFKIEGAMDNRSIWGGRRRDINYHEQVDIDTKDGETITFSSDDYSNYKELYDFINARKLSLSKESK